MTTTATREEACLSCGATQVEEFCPKCGEKRVSEHDYSVSHFVEHSIEGLTHFDLRSLRALKTLVFHPGELTRSYLDGRRRAFVGPVQLFLILNVVFAILGGDTFRTRLAVQEHDQPFPTMKRAMVADQVAHTALSHEEFAKEFDRNAGVQAKTWIFAMIPGLALFLAMLYGFRRYFFEHLVFATHFMGFLFLLIIGTAFVLGVVLRIAGRQLGNQGFDNVVSLLILGGLIIYLYVALRRTYRDRWYAAALRSLALGAFITPLLLAYRFLLFFVTLKTMH